jgi:hypothetical protein
VGTGFSDLQIDLHTLNQQRLKLLLSQPSQFLIFCAWRASWLRIVAGSGVNFSETVATEAKFCFSEREFRLNFLL